MADGVESVIGGSSAARGAIGVIETVASVAVCVSAMDDADRALYSHQSASKTRSKIGDQ